MIKINEGKNVNKSQKTGKQANRHYIDIRKQTKSLK